MRDYTGGSWPAHALVPYNARPRHRRQVPLNVESKAEIAAMPELSSFVDPYLEKTWGELNVECFLSEHEGQHKVRAILGYPAEGMAESLGTALGKHLGHPVELELEFVAPASAKRIPGVAHIIAVASGKGGVGKSTTAVNLALALSAEGAKTGLLDADIYGPSQGMMLGVAEHRRPDVREVDGSQRFVPVRAHGLQAMSMSFLTTDKTPMVWRGPMVSGALQQLINQTLWNDLDYLIVDMPPGTGDIQLTLSQSVPVAGSVIVTTPQDIALLDAKKAIEMFTKVDIPVLGILENMSVHICSECGHQSHIFGEHGAASLAADYDQVMLGNLPLDLDIRMLADAGNPNVAADPDSAVSSIYREAARHMAARLWERSATQLAPTINFSDD